MLPAYTESLMKIPLEDNFHDIIGKACRGLGLADEQLAQQTGLSAQTVAAVKDGQFDEDAVRKMASVLGLGADALVALGRKDWFPRDPGPVEGLACFNTPFEDMTVNSYVVWDPETKEAAAFDTGADCSGLLGLPVKIGQILITHSHGDHIVDLPRLKEATGAPAYASDREPVDGAEPFADGRTFRIGRVTVETRRTSGHASGGVSYVINGLARPLVIAGDAIFAGSMGGGMVSYAEALETGRAALMTLPDETVVCPGHGPLTTIGEEKRHNPFFSK
jgi:glyoxylase-like metal-dependent hydrolase (beta-lactamase superfamily II)